MNRKRSCQLMVVLSVFIALVAAGVISAEEKKPAPTPKPPTPKLSDFTNRDGVPYTTTPYLENRWDEMGLKLAYKARNKREWEVWHNKAVQKLRSLLCLDAMKKAPLNPKITDEVDCGDYIRQRVEIQTEPGIHAVVYRLADERLISRPPKEPKRAILYVAHHSSDAELREEPLIAELLEAEPNSAFYTCDVRGIGESRPDTCNENSYLSAYGNDYFYAIHSIMLGKPYAGQRTRDILRVLQWLKSHDHNEVHLVAKGWGTIPATFAAALSDQVKQVTLKNAVTSYSDIAESETYSWPLSALVPNILKSFDLPDCYKFLKRKNLKQIDPRGPNGP